MQPIDLITELREQMGMPAYDQRATDQQIWKDTMAEVEERLGDRLTPVTSPDHTHSITTFEYELLPSTEGVRERIQQCEGRHVQQAIFSTYMNTLTQICFTERKIRSTIGWDGNRSWNIS